MYTHSSRNTSRDTAAMNVRTEYRMMPNVSKPDRERNERFQLSFCHLQMKEELETDRAFDLV